MRLRAARADDAKHAHSLANVPDKPRAGREGDGQRRRWSHESRAQAPVRRRTQLEYIAFSYSSRCRPAAADTLARRLRRLHGQTPMESQMGGRDCTKGGDDAEQARNTGARRRHAPMENPQSSRLRQRMSGARKRRGFDVHTVLGAPYATQAREPWCS